MISGLTQQLRDRLSKKKFEAVLTSYTGLRPGDLIQFTYMGAYRNGFIVGSSGPGRSDGLFLSSRNLTLYNVLVTDVLDDDTFQSLLDTIYNDEYLAHYDRLKSKFPETAREKFRTMQVMGIRSIIKILIEPSDEQYEPTS
tara:strand:- start:349 stop:771 length:423 start_codon:yes stop_codon:yes gene_type:complete